MNMIEFILGSPRNIIIIIMILILIVFCILFFYKGLKDDDNNIKKINYGYGIFIFGYALTRIFFLFSDYERFLNGLTNLHYMYVSIAYTISMFALLVISLVIERYLVKFKYIFVISSAIALLFSIISLFALEIQSITQIIMYIAAGIVLLGIIGMYIYLVIKLSGKYRRRALGALFGFLLIAIGLILDIRVLEDIFGTLDPVRQIVSPISMLIGFIIFGITQIE
ncbi:MAG: hypothetical protein ACTSWR_10305 [Candidatus Helarchaeota archaeon]